MKRLISVLAAVATMSLSGVMVAPGASASSIPYNEYANPPAGCNGGWYHDGGQFRCSSSVVRTLWDGESNPGRWDEIGIGLNGQVWKLSWNDQTWRPWGGIARTPNGSEIINGDPVMEVWTNGDLLYCKYWNGSEWSPSWYYCATG